MAEPTPAFDSGSEPMIDSVAGAITSPIPPARITIATSRWGYPLVTGTPARKISPAETRTKPVPTTALVPTRSTTRGDIGATTSITSDIGNMRIPACRAEKPSTVCRYWVIRNIEPNMAKNVMVMAALAAENRRFWKNRTSSIGYLLFSSQTMKVPITTKPMTKAVTTLLSPHPLAGASMMAHSSETSPMIERAAPTRSSRGASGSRDVGSRKRPAMSAPIVTGTLIRKTEPHQKWASSNPPSTGPMAPPAPARAAQTPMARPRSRASMKMLVSSDSVLGMINAPPMPMKHRVKISMVDEVAMADMIEPAQKMMRPICRAPLRPKRSPRAPAVSSRPANTRV